MSQTALELFSNYTWPGNVRELKNTIERLVIFSDESEISLETVLGVVPGLAASQTKIVNNESVRDRSLKGARSEFEKDFIVRKLTENDWNVSRTAVALGIERSHLHKKMKNFGIEER